MRSRPRAPAQDDAAGDAAALRRRVAELEAECQDLRGRLARAGLDAADTGLRHATKVQAGQAALTTSEAERQGLRSASAALEASEARLRLVLESATEYAIPTTDLQGTITGWNRGAENVLGWAEREALGQHAAMFFTPEDRAAGAPEAEMRTALEQGRAADERWHLRRDGTRFWASGTMLPQRGPDGAAVGFLKILRDRTEQRLAAEREQEAAERLREAAQANALLVKEAHHRVKNSLQLVQTLLHLQARAAKGNPEAAAQLQESAARVQTIGAMHEQLYRTGAGLDVAVGDYLRGLAQGLCGAMASKLEGRRVEVDADNPTWPAAAVPTLGLVLTELVTNALKYGRGMVRVTFRQPWGEPGASLAQLAVEDEGTDLPAGFDPKASGGFGMRIVSGLLRGPGAGLEVDRTCPHTRFVARLPVPEAMPASGSEAA